MSDHTSPPAGPPPWGAPRSKTVTWHDPAVIADAGKGMSGLDLLTTVLRGELPPAPIAELTGFRLTHVAEGEAVFEGTPDESVYNPIGAVHGGLVCTMLDSAAGCAVHTLLPAGTGYTSVEIKVNYLRPVWAGMPLRVRGRVTKPGRRIAFAEAELTDDQGRPLATASSSCLILGG